MENRKPPMRTCIGCKKIVEKKELLRIVKNDKTVVPDSKACKDGRGAYLCRDVACLEEAIKRKAFQRVFNKVLDEKEEAALRDEIEKNS